ncbi:gliding motility-associated C-terminal domain-containing protein [Paracrocinitomix mangrovi]|uniref:T9SS type B sorting domain-containing protein n=1 Tax=Paracrocinitomix mangrovi TaxID=2862509 RepID=UPI001C8EBBF7|nr:gliding motility-associated C-terminal domain-containing protein [Paracrocinitomix mangrovi]UKN01138.1 gliding motility-associated C-terminal domain-containing protein [Paracrocinitomix mangrovi]
MSIIFFELQNVLFALMFLLCFSSAYGQLDTKHYIPPLYGREDLGTHYLVLGTPISNTFNVTVEDGAGNLIMTIPISSASSSTTQIGIGTSSPFLVSETQLNTAVSAGKGLILTANEPFYASIRVIETAQAGSLTSKGQKAALGQEFRTAHMSNNYGYNQGKSNTFSIMATENNTQVNISEINPGVIFRGTISSGSPLTTQSVTVSLDAGESYVVATHIDESGSTNNINGLNGTLITSDKDIVVNCGTWLGGNAMDGTSNNGSSLQGRDIGIDQIVPKKNIGNEYVLIKGFGVDNEKTFVVASEPNTDIYLNGSSTPSANLANAGDFYVISGGQFSANKNLYMSSSSPVFVTQSLNGGDGYSDDNERQSGINFLPPIKCTGSKEVTIPAVEFIGTPYINIVADVGAVIEVNGNVIGGGLSVPGTPDYVTYQLSGYSGDVEIVSDKPIRVALLNLNGNIGAAGYFSGFSKDINISADYLNNNLPANDEIVEGCGIATVTIERSSLYADVAETILLDVQGSAIEGTDYSMIPDQLTFAAGQTTLSFDIEAYQDYTSENVEDVIITIMLDNQSCGEDELIFTIINRDPIVAEITGSNPLCPGEEIQLSANVSGGAEPYQYSWSNGGSNQDILVAPLSSTIYQLYVSDVCESDTAFDDFEVIVPQYQLQLLTSNDTSILCPYTDLIIAAEASGGLSDYNYEWFVDGNSVYNGPAFTISPSVTTSYTVVVTDQCGLTKEANIEVDVQTSLMQATASEHIVCPYDSTLISVDVSGGLPPFEYYWYHNGETTNNTWVQPAWTTSYLVQIQDACQTYSIFENANVEVLQPTANFYVLSNTQMENLPISFGNNSLGAENWYWDLGNGETSTDFAPYTLYENDGEYIITLIATNYLGCTDTTVKSIFIKPEFYFYAPNAFTPNGDLYNNTYSVSVIGAASLEFYIFNRWGEQVYFSDNPYFQWDGTYNNVLVEDGVYVYKCKIIADDGSSYLLNGHINVLK